MINGCPELSAILAIEPKEKLGAGTFGQVTKMGDYVVKEMPLKYRRDDVNFKRELEAWETLSRNEEIKPYLPPFCYGLIKPSASLFGTGYLIHHHIPTITLAQFLKTKKYLPLNEQFSYKLSMNLIHAFELLYEAGYIHRDIKPANILIRDPEHTLAKDIVKPLIIDFGLVCKAPCGESDTIGTRSFMPQNWIPQDERNYVPFYKDPVILGANKFVKVDPRVIAPFFNQTTDLYALGIVLRSIYKRTEWIRFKTPDEIQEHLGRDASPIELKLMKRRNDIQYAIQEMFAGVTATHASLRGQLVDPAKVVVNNGVSNTIKQQFLENAPARLAREAEMARDREAAVALERALANFNDNAESNNNTPNNTMRNSRKRKANQPPNANSNSNAKAKHARPNTRRRRGL